MSGASIQMQREIEMEPGKRAEGLPCGSKKVSKRPRTYPADHGRIKA